MDQIKISQYDIDECIRDAFTKLSVSTYNAVHIILIDKYI